MPWRCIGEWRYSSFLTIALDGGEFVSSWPSLFTLGKETLVTYWIGGWVGPRAGLCPCWESNLCCPACGYTNRAVWACSMLDLTIKNVIKRSRYQNQQEVLPLHGCLSFMHWLACFILWDCLFAWSFNDTALSVKAVDCHIWQYDWWIGKDSEVGRS
jgi:hypothetical protein